jgi:hypothetical protein
MAVKKYLLLEMCPEVIHAMRLSTYEGMVELVDHISGWESSLLGGSIEAPKEPGRQYSQARKGVLISWHEGSMCGRTACYENAGMRLPM